MTVKSPDDILRERGLFQASHDAGWYLTTLWVSGKDTMGWGIPVYDRDGNEIIARRWKNANPAAPKGEKCRWIKGRPDVDFGLYYYLPETKEAIAEDDGKLFLAGGEPDLLAFRSTGRNNTLCWFDGESAIPDSFIADMRALGVTQIFYFPDRDEAGTKAANSIARKLDGSEIRFTAYDLPFEFGSKGDINSLLMRDRDSEAFWDSLRNCPETELEPVATQGDQLTEMATRRKPSANGKAKPGKINFDSEFIKWVDAVKAKIQSPKKQGKHFQCVNPVHPDNDPSARISYDKDTVNGKYVCTCGLDHTWHTVAGWVGMTPWGEAKAKLFADNRQRAQEAKFPYTKPITFGEDEPPVREPDAERLAMRQHITPELLNFGIKWDDIPIEKVLFSSDDATELYKRRRSGVYISKTTLAPFPFEAFHHLGGAFRIGAPGDVYGFLGLSGFGKTSFLDSMIDVCRQNGEHCLLISPEIPWWKMADRLVQRWGGPTVTESQLDDLYHRERQNGKVRFGQALSSDQTNKALMELDYAQDSWDGKLFMIDTYGANVMWLFAAIYKTIDHLWEKRNIRVNRVFLDYIQLLDAPKEYYGKMSYSDMLKMFNALIRQIGAVGYVPSQVRKSDTRDAMEGKREMQQDAGMNIRDFLFKAFATMTPGFKPEKVDGRRVVDDHTIFNVTKNNEGKRGKVEIQTIWKEMLFVDHGAGDLRANYADNPSRQNGYDDDE